MNLQQLTQKVQQLAQQMQQTHDLAKKISELPQQSNLDANSLVHVSRNGVSESLELQKLIDAIISYNYDRLVSVGLITIAGNILNIPALVEWVISQVNYIKTSETNIEIPLSATGNIRIDFILGNEVGEVYRYAGPENEGVAIRQSVPPGNILITELTVTDSGISEPSEPITGSDYITKSSRGDNFIGATGENVLLPEPSDKVGFRLIAPGLISIDGILYGGGFGSTITVGDLFPITNVTGNSVTLNHSSYFITDNYVLPNERVVLFRYEGSGIYRIVGVNQNQNQSKPQKTVVGNVLIDNSYNGAIVKVKATATITIPAGLVAGFEFDYTTYTGVTATLVAGAGVTLNYANGLILGAKKMGTIFNDGTNIYEVRGEQS